MYETQNMNNHEAYAKIIEQIKTIRRGADNSPHKFILLLSLIELFDKNPNHDNRFLFEEIEPFFIECFNLYYSDYADHRKMLEHPFYYLKNDGFWNLHLIDGQEEKFHTYEKMRLTKKRLNETVDYGYLSEEQYNLFTNSEQRQLLKETIISMLSIQYDFKDQLGLIAKESSLFEHEQVAIEIIRNSIVKMKLGKMLNNVLIYDNQTKNYYEYDLVIISHTGLYVIELKHWSGKLQIAPYNWEIHGTQYRADPHKINGFKCKVLKGIYQHHFRTYPNIWVESIVILTNPDVEVEGADSPASAVKEAKHNVTFASIGDFLIYLKKNNESSNPLLSNEQIRNIADYLQDLNRARAGSEYTIAGHQTLDYLSRRSDSIELLARPTGTVARGLNRFRVFRVPDTLTGIERERFVRKAYNTLAAVSQLRDHPNIHKVWLVPNDDGDIIEGSDWSETGTLRDYINSNKGTLDADEVNSICYGIAQGLIAAHRNSIIHRAVKPENILLSNKVPKLMNFDLAFQMDENHITVISDLESLPDDGYIAPEVLRGQDIDETTDFFALGVIAYELFTGFRPFKKVRQFISAGGELSESALAILKEKHLPAATIELIEALLQADRRKRPNDINQILAAFSGDKSRVAGSSTITLNAYLQPGDTYDMYEILEFIGEGREAQIYKAKNGRSETVALKLFNREIERERIFKEGDNTAAVKSAYVVGCNNTIGHWRDDRYFLVLDYIEGESMRSWIDNKMIPQEKTFRDIAMCLLRGVQAFHNHVDESGEIRTLLHSDIKPDNILISKDGKAVLIDCGIAGSPRIDVFQGTLAYIPPDSLSGADMQFSVDGDLFALGISLWEWLCGQRPYDQLAVGEKPCLNTECLAKLPSHIQDGLLKATAPEREKRFLKVEDMLAAFTGIAEHPKPHSETTAVISEELPSIAITKSDTGDHNPFVRYLNSLSNASAGNENATAEAQIGNNFFPRIRVAHPASQFIYRQLFEAKKHVILTGNAGDGKTTIAAEVYNLHLGEYKPLSVREESSDFVMIKDLSELPEQERPEVFQEAIEHPQKPYLIVSNTGTLLENLSKLQLNGKHIDKSQLLTALEADHPLLLGEGRFLIVNIGRINSISAALSVGGRMLETDNWQQCRSCSLSQDCPIHTNVKLLQENRDLIMERIGLAYQRMYEYGSRLTMRQMTGHLAYIITAGLNCEDITGMSKLAMEEQYPRYLFFNRFFGDDGRSVVPEALQLLPVRKIREAELGIYLDPFMERKIWKVHSEMTQLSDGVSDVLEHIRGVTENSGHENRMQVRRLLYFVLPLQEPGTVPYLTGFLSSPMLLSYLEHVLGNRPFTRIQEDSQMRLLLQVLQECFAGVRLLEDEYRSRDLYITLKAPGYSTTQMVLGKAHVEDFSLGIKNIYDTGEIKHRVLIMRYKDGQAELELDLPFLDYVARRYRGEVAEELSVFYVDRLQRFKIALLESLKKAPGEGHIELISMAGSRSFETISIKVDNDHLEVIM